MQTLVKFHTRNTAGRAGGHPVATSTLGKKGLIDYGWRPVAGQTMPEAGELWRVQIIRETQPGLNRGCLILQPLHKVDPSEMRYLVPGTFDTTKTHDGATLVATPKISQGDLSAQQVNYMFPLEYKRQLRRDGVVTYVINLGGEPWLS